MCASMPLPCSRAVTDNRPSASIWKLTRMWTDPATAGGMPRSSKRASERQWATAVAMTGNIVRALDGMVPPDMIHLYLDNFWLRLGKDLGAISYLEDVIIEHMHPAAGKGEWDAGYKEVNASEVYDADRIALDTYLLSPSYSLLLLELTA